MEEWDRLLPQCTITLNSLRASRRNPSLSAHTAVFGVFNFAATPLAPPGTKVLVHLKPDQVSTYGVHVLDGWYIGPSLEHYRCLKCYIPETKGTRDSDTVEFFPSKFPLPHITTDDYLRQAATDIVSILKCKLSKLTPSLEYGEPINNAYV